MVKEKLTWKDSDAPDADGKFRDLNCSDLASWSPLHQRHDNAESGN